MKYQLIIIAIYTSLTAFSQTKEFVPPPPSGSEELYIDDNEDISKDISEIEIIGSARIVVKPDIGILFISLLERGENMKESINILENKTNYYGKLFREKGFNTEDLKTSNFEVKLDRLYKNGEYVDNGYKASQNLIFEFAYSENKLKQVLSVFYESKENANFRFEFRLSENLKSKVQKEILIQSVKDGKEKAEIIAVSSGQRIIKLIKTSYGGWNNSSSEMEMLSKETEYAPPAILERASSSIISKNFTPDDLIFYDTVTMKFIVE